ncbi:hypothetical protein EI94DRAFT_1800874 [Lactarius quietus]|nr:hypothetical protein EI94DRAFT_1800874 [Lactarius quietus]
MTTLPIATYCTADTATSNSHADKQAESGGLFLCLRQYEVSSDKATAPLPLEVVIPQDRLPDVLDVPVYDTDTIRNATSPTTSPEYGWVGVAAWNNLEKFLAHNLIKFVRTYLPSLYMTSDLSEASDTLDKRTIGQLDLRRKQHLVKVANHAFSVRHSHSPMRSHLYMATLLSN